MLEDGILWTPVSSNSTLHSGWTQKVHTMHLCCIDNGIEVQLHLVAAAHFLLSCVVCGDAGVLSSGFLLIWNPNNSLYNLFHLLPSLHGLHSSLSTSISLLFSPSFSSLLSFFFLVLSYFFSMWMWFCFSISTGLVCPNCPKNFVQIFFCPNVWTNSEYDSGKKKMPTTRKKHYSGFV